MIFGKNLDQECIALAANRKCFLNMICTAKWYVCDDTTLKFFKNSIFDLDLSELIRIGQKLSRLVRTCQDWSALVRIGQIYKTKCDDTTTDLEFNWSFLKKISWSTLQRKHYMAAEKYFYLQPWISDET